jgi:hypothetical protein
MPEAGMNATRRLFDLRLWIVISLLVVWLAVSVLILIGRGDVESLLGSAFGRNVRPDAFEFLNQIAVSFWASHSLLASLAFLASWQRRVDVLLVLMIGPVIALLVCLASQEWSDPNWHNVLAVYSIGCVVGTLVTVFYWWVKPRRRSND